MKAKKFLCSYGHTDGYQYSFEIMANSMEDAEAKLTRLKQNARLDGELMLSIPVPFFGRFIWGGKPRSPEEGE